MIIKIQKIIRKIQKDVAIQTDKTNPKIEGLESGSVIEVQCGTQFNLNEYLKDKISISDDVTVDLKRVLHRMWWKGIW